MITFQNLNNQYPYLKLKEKYDEAIQCNQELIEAISVSSFSHVKNEVDSRFVNLKFINNEEFIFFSNYDSPKSKQFISHDQVSVLIFWSKINTQIRIKAKIKKIPGAYSKEYFRNRSQYKNALAISSKQSEQIDSYESVKIQYEKVLAKEDLTVCPEYWGGFSFTPYSFEFWEGNDSRLNKREAYSLINGIWSESILQP